MAVSHASDKFSLIDAVVGVLSDSGFSVSDCRGIQSCFDIIARKGERILLVKVLMNIEGLTCKNSMELKGVASLLSATPMIVGDHMKSTELSDGVIYDRYGVSVVNMKTMREMMTSEKNPTVYSIRGNYCVNINPKSLTALRASCGLSQRELADRLKVSKQSIYRYESSGRISLHTAEKLVKFFDNEGEKLALMRKRVLEATPSPVDGTFDVHLTELKKRIIGELNEIGFSTTPTNAPFDVLAQDKERVFTVISNDWRRIERRVSITAEISDIVGGYSACITERKVEVGAAVITPDELKEIRSCRELIRRITSS